MLKKFFFYQTGGMIVNSGQHIGVLGERIGRGPARAVKPLLNGFPTRGDRGDDSINEKTLSKVSDARDIQPQLSNGQLCYNY